MKHSTTKTAYYHLPGLFEFYDLYSVFLPLFYSHREYFYDWCDIASVYGASAKLIDFAIDVDVPDEKIVTRMAGRRACVKCGMTYHIVYAAPKKEGICDKCGAELILRDDDKPETVTKRLSVYHEQTRPLISFYADKHVLYTVDGTQNMEQVFEAITKILGA
jgi:adenylate kinase family enzyme